MNGKHQHILLPEQPLLPIGIRKSKDAETQIRIYCHQYDHQIF